MTSAIEVKCWPEAFASIWHGRKLAEYRYNDRPYAVGCRLLLREWDPLSERYSGRRIVAEVTDMQRGPDWGIAEGYVMMSISVQTRSDDSVSLLAFVSRKRT